VFSTAAASCAFEPLTVAVIGPLMMSGVSAVLPGRRPRNRYGGLVGWMDWVVRLFAVVGVCACWAFLYYGVFGQMLFLSRTGDGVNGGELMLSNRLLMTGNNKLEVDSPCHKYI